jgi:hypothetical protein
MHDKEPASLDYVAWARGVNAEWIVHRGLNRKAADYIEHLAKVDPARLERSGRAAYLLTRKRDPADDPKPWFYGGLFSLATADEAKEFLASHSFTAALVPAARENPKLKAWLAKVSPKTCDCIGRIRKALDEVSA